MTELKSNIFATRIDCRKVSAKPHHKNGEADLRKYLINKETFIDKKTSFRKAQKYLSKPF